MDLRSENRKEGRERGLGWDELRKEGCLFRSLESESELGGGKGARLTDKTELLCMW